MKRIAVLLIAFALFGCTRSEDNGRVLNLLLSEDIKSLDPAQSYDTVSNTVMPLANETLLQYHYLKRPLQLTPLLADGMPEVSKDKLTYTFKIKHGVLFADDKCFDKGKGRELKAADFLYGWKRLSLPELVSPGTWVFDGKVVGWDDFRKKMNAAAAGDREKILHEPVEGMTALDDYTLQVKLLQPYPQLLNVMTLGFTAPIAEEATKKYGQGGLSNYMVGTGPFRLTQYVQGSKVTLEKNPTFRGEAYPSEGDDEAKKLGLLAAAGQTLPFVDKIYFHEIKESQPAWLEFMKGRLDENLIPKDNFDAAVEGTELRPEVTAKGILLQKSEEAGDWYLNFNMKDPVVGGNHADLRKALSMAIDRKGFITKFLNGRGVEATSMVPRVIQGHIERPAIVNGYNLAEAKKLLAKAGYPEGKGLPTLKWDVRGASTTSKQEAEFIQQNLAAIGVKMDIVINTFPAYLRKEQNGNLQIFLGGWSADYPDAENFLMLLAGKNAAPGPNASNYQNPAFDKLYEQMAAMEPSPARTEVIRKAEDIAFNDGVWGMMWYPVRYYIYQGWLKNYRPSDQIQNDVKYYDIDLDRKKELKAKL